MKRLLHTSMFYTIIGLIGGVFYREYTKMMDFEGSTQLGLVHTHFLMLGMFMFFIILLMEKQFQIMRHKWFNAFYICYNIGLLITGGMLTTHGIMTVQGKTTGPAISGIAGLGHIFLGIGIAILFVILYKSISGSKNEPQRS
ncbi:DUF2871 domain-containing protein [Paenibacillus sp. 1001270B_150601_E10]|uniref:DUF2871 domain-containing protein n=1 Tax=Paenibacillus sp. 1001270B_150601_E10 TaxID=2787079 RepID=UPI00189E02F5|nr:DUF2871 domain-containing protein [Paenibacillus sp. 1001270B_150601_E10]